MNRHGSLFPLGVGSWSLMSSASPGLLDSSLVLWFVRGCWQTWHRAGARQRTWPATTAGALRARAIPEQGCEGMGLPMGMRYVERISERVAGRACNRV